MQANEANIIKLAEAAWNRDYSRIQPEDWTETALLAATGIVHTNDRFYAVIPTPENGMSDTRRTINIILSDLAFQRIPRHVWSKDILLTPFKSYPLALHALAAEGRLDLIEHLDLTREELLTIHQGTPNKESLLQCARTCGRLHSIPTKFIAPILREYRSIITAPHMYGHVDQKACTTKMLQAAQYALAHAKITKKRTI